MRIRQSWHAADPEFRGIELVIDPKRAFGTGYHATTQLVVEWLEEHIRGGERVLDVGTGSAILAMTAIRLGAASALGLDNDPVAVECAAEYAALNGFGGELELRVASFEDLDAGKFDVIVANLDIRTLPRLCEFLKRLMADGAIACLSGLQEQDYEEVAAALAQAGLDDHRPPPTRRLALALSCTVKALTWSAALQLPLLSVQQQSRQLKLRRIRITPTLSPRR